MGQNGYRTHIRLHTYQREYLEQNNHNMSEVIREGIDDFMIQQGADPDQWEETYGE